MQPHIHTRSLLVMALALALGAYGWQIAQTQPSARIAYDSQNLLRLHVIANSDSATDQNLKLAVRDALLPLLQQSMESKSAQAAELQVLAQKEKLLVRAGEVIRSAGQNYPVQIEIGEYGFPEKYSPAITLPAGEYRAVRVIIGSGAGRNWWCVMFPPMCFTQEAAGIQATAAASTGKDGKTLVQVRTRLLPELARKAYLVKVAQLWRGSISHLARLGAAEAHPRIASSRTR